MFSMCSQQDLQQSGLIICMGTSLKVEPFASLLDRAPLGVPRLLINREVPAGFRRRAGDLILTGDCDEQVTQLAQALGWTDELQDFSLIELPWFNAALDWSPTIRLPSARIRSNSHWRRGM